jgi:hypothetical protein
VSKPSSAKLSPKEGSPISKFQDIQQSLQQEISTALNNEQASQSVVMLTSQPTFDLNTLQVSQDDCTNQELFDLQINNDLSDDDFLPLNIEA